MTGDGSKKRQAGKKQPWWKDDTHETAIFSHLYKWKRGEKHDRDSHAHPLVHLAWRALAIAYQETVGQVDPDAMFGPSEETPIPSTTDEHDALCLEAAATFLDEAIAELKETDYFAPRETVIKELKSLADRFEWSVRARRNSDRLS